MQVCDQKAVSVNPQNAAENPACVEKANEWHSPVPLQLISKFPERGTLPPPDWSSGALQEPEGLWFHWAAGRWDRKADCCWQRASTVSRFLPGYYKLI